jgi:hypothetical protein
MRVLFAAGMVIALNFFTSNPDSAASESYEGGEGGGFGVGNGIASMASRQFVDETAVQSHMDSAEGHGQGNGEGNGFSTVGSAAAWANGNAVPPSNAEGFGVGGGFNTRMT